VLLLSLWLLASGSHAATDDASNSVFLLPDQPRVALAQAIRYREDRNANLTLEQIRTDTAEQSWSNLPTHSDTVSFGYTKSAYWLHTRITNASQTQLHRLLDIGYPVLDHLDIYIVQGNNVISHWQLGDKNPFHQRPIQHHHFVVPLDIDPGVSVHLYLRVATSSSMQIPLLLWERTAFLEHTHKQSMTMGIYYGIMIVMVLYNLFVFVSVRETTYFYYVGYAAFMCLFVASLQGISFQYLWPDSVEWNDQIIIISLLGLFVFGGLFTEHFLQLAKHKPRLSKVFFAFVILAAVGIVASFFVP
jgi:diguanylate cyclase